MNFYVRAYIEDTFNSLFEMPVTLRRYLYRLKRRCRILKTLSILYLRCHARKFI